MTDIYLEIDGDYEYGGTKVNAFCNGHLTCFVYHTSPDGESYLSSIWDDRDKWESSDFPIGYEDLLATVKTYIINQ